MCARVYPYLSNILRECAILSFVASLAPPYFSSLSHKRHDFRKRVTEHKTCVSFSLKLLLKTFLSLKKNSARYCYKVKSLHVKYPLFLSHLNQIWIFSTDSRKESLNIKFHQNSSSGSRLVPCGRTDMTKQNSRFFVIFQTRRLKSKCKRNRTVSAARYSRVQIRSTSPAFLGQEKDIVHRVSDRAPDL